MKYICGWWRFITSGFTEGWDRIIWNLDGDSPVMKIKTIVAAFGCHIDLHLFERADLPHCFHSHPAWAIRLPFIGGYTEEVRAVMDEFILKTAFKDINADVVAIEIPGEPNTGVVETERRGPFSFGEPFRIYTTGFCRFKRVVKPWRFSIVAPAMSHRLDSFLKGGRSWSLWLRGPVIAPIVLSGEGWPPEMRGVLRTSGNHDSGKSL